MSRAKLNIPEAIAPIIKHFGKWAHNKAAVDQVLAAGWASVADLPLCAHCGEHPISWSSHTNSPSQTCSPECSRSLMDPETKAKLLDRAWLIEQREVHKVPKAALATQLGISETTLKKYLVQHGIEDRDLKVKSGGVTAEFLQQRYVVENKSADEIATEIGMSRPSVFRLLKKFGVAR